MVFVCFVHVIISLFMKILLDDEIDDFLRKNRQKTIAKKRKLKNKILHFDVRKIIPKRYIYFNFILFALALGTIVLTFLSFFISPELNRLFENISIVITLASALLITTNRIFELLFDRHTKLWNKGLLIGVVLIVFVLLLIRS